MCQLLGMNCNTPTDIVFSFTGFACRAGRTGEHVDGWGVAFFEGNGVRHFVDHQAALVSPVAELIRRYPIKSQNVVAHIRKATVGQVSLENCHPFVRELWGRYWVFAHNGDLKHYEPLLTGPYLPVGTTDSELAFCWMLQSLRNRFPTRPAQAQLNEAVRELSAEISAHGTFNFMLSDGTALFAHCSTNLYYLVRQHPFALAKLCDEDMSVDFASITTPSDRIAMIVTEPLTHNEPWTKFQPGELKVFIDGLPAASSIHEFQLAV
jgi:glutamine amidotransferase